MKIAVAVERGKRRVFAGAVEWPGWCRSAKDEDGALAALLAYGPRYAGSLGGAVGGLTVPRTLAGLHVVERLDGDATTDFGAPSIALSADERDLSSADLDRLLTILEASWGAFDAAAKKHARATLSVGPRGGGRSVAAMTEHVDGADRAYLSALGSGWRKPPGSGTAELRAELLATIAARANGEAPARTPKAGAWTPRFTVRRSAWHALDHAWEIEDRAR